MFGIKSTQNRRYELLQRRYDRLESKCKELQIENNRLNNELGICKEKIEHTEKAKEEFEKMIHEARDIKEKYEEAFNELSNIRKNYTHNVKDLIRDIRRK